jgi:hypothetical protein
MIGPALLRGDAPMVYLVLRAAALAALAYLYDQGIFLALTRFNALELPWMPYTQQSPLAVALLIHTASFLAVLCVALPLGAMSAVSAGARPFLFGLAAAAPSFADQALSVPPLVGKSLFSFLFSFMYCLEVLLPMLLLPPLAALLLRRLVLRLRRRRAGGFA